MSRDLDTAVFHDVKNRLTVLGNELSKLEELQLAPEARIHLRVAAEQAQVVTRKLVEYLTVQRAADPGGLRAQVAEQMPALLLDDMCASAALLSAGRLSVTAEDQAAPELWFYDSHLVRLALDSAVYNALRFARSRITVGAKVENSRLCFYIRDDGPGVQLDPARESTGLGLRMCKAIAAAHHNHGESGQCSLRNDEIHGGAVFELSLP